MKMLLGNNIILSVVSKRARELPLEIKDLFKDQTNAHGARYNRVIILAFNPSGDETYKPNLDKDDQKKKLFQDLKSNARIVSQNLWLGETVDSHTLTAYLVADEQAFMAMTESGIINQAAEADIRKEFRANEHGRK